VLDDGFGTRVKKRSFWASVNFEYCLAVDRKRFRCTARSASQRSERGARIVCCAAVNSSIVWPGKPQSAQACPRMLWAKTAGMSRIWCVISRSLRVTP